MSNCSSNNNAGDSTSLLACGSRPVCPATSCIREATKEIVKLCNASCVLDTYIFKTGYQQFCHCGMRGIVVNCGINVKYTDCHGCVRSAVKDCSIVFCNVPNNIYINPRIHICNPPCVKLCNNAVKVEFPVFICENAVAPTTPRCR